MHTQECISYHTAVGLPHEFFQSQEYLLFMQKYLIQKFLVKYLLDFHSEVFTMLICGADSQAKWFAKMSSQQTKYSPLLLQIQSLKFLLVEGTASYLKQKKQKSSVKSSACNTPPLLTVDHGKPTCANNFSTFKTKSKLLNFFIFYDSLGILALHYY